MGSTDLLNCCSRATTGAIGLLLSYVSPCHILLTTALTSSVFAMSFYAGAELLSSAKLAFTLGMGFYLGAPIAGSVIETCTSRR